MTGAQRRRLVDLSIEGRALCGVGGSIALSRLLVKHGRLFRRVRDNALTRRDGQLLPARDDVDANSSALPFQRP